MQLVPTVNPPTHIAELEHLTNNLQQLTITLQPHPNLQTHGRTSAHSYAEIDGHVMCHAVTNEPHHVFASRYPHISWMGHHKAG